MRQHETVLSVLGSIGHEVRQPGRTTCPLCSSRNSTAFQFSDHGFHCWRCGESGHIGDLKRLLGIARWSRPKPKARITPLYPDGYAIVGNGLNWLLGPLKATVAAALLHRGLDGAPVEWSHSFARSKVSRGSRTTIVATRQLLEALGLITVTHARGRYITRDGRTRRGGDRVVVHPMILFRLHVFADRWRKELGRPGLPDFKLPLTLVHAWILATWRIARDGAKDEIPAPPEIPGIPVEFWMDLINCLSHSQNYCTTTDPEQGLASDLLRRSYGRADFRHPEPGLRRFRRRRGPIRYIEGDLNDPNALAPPGIAHG